MGKQNRYARVWQVKAAGVLVILARPSQATTKAHVEAKIQDAIAGALGNSPELGLIVEVEQGQTRYLDDDAPELGGERVPAITGDRNVYVGKVKVTPWAVRWAGGTPIFTQPDTRRKALIKAYIDAIRSALGGSAELDIKVEAEDRGVHATRDLEARAKADAPKAPPHLKAVQ